MLHFCGNNFLPFRKSMESKVHETYYYLNTGWTCNICLPDHRGNSLLSLDIQYTRRDFFYIRWQKLCSLNTMSLGQFLILESNTVSVATNIIESIGPLWRRRISTIVALFTLLTSKSPP